MWFDLYRCSVKWISGAIIALMPSIAASQEWLPTPDATPLRPDATPWRIENTPLGAADAGFGADGFTLVRPGT